VAKESRLQVRVVLKDASVTGIVVEQQDRLTRCGCHDLQALLAVQARQMEVQMEGVNRAENDGERPSGGGGRLGGRSRRHGLLVHRPPRRAAASQAGKAREGTDRR
jgi:hypothetical protein